MNFKHVITGDGSKTLYLQSLDETYHSNHGALQESMHVYIQSGLQYLIDNKDVDQLNVFEMGFGTGLNAYLTAYYSRLYQKKVFYTSIEKFPLKESDYRKLEYFNLIESDLYTAESEKIAQAPWGEKIAISEFFVLEKIEEDFFNFNRETANYDIIYYDAFGHRAQSEMWELRPFEICCSLLRKGGILVTYASKGSARRNLIQSGFEVKKIPGAPGKREMMRAIKV